MKILMRAGTDGTFRADCLGPNGRTVMQDQAQVTFDPDIVLRCFPDKEVAAKEIALIIPDLPVPANTPVTDYWLCTYVDYIPASRAEAAAGSQKQSGPDVRK
jgi:hypothetical protein